MVKIYFRMTLLGATNLLLGALVIHASTASPGPETVTPVDIGLLIVYDRNIYWNITDEYGHEPHVEKWSPEDYFASFIAAVQLRFRDTKKLSVRLSLVNATLLNDDVARDIFETAPGYYETVNGTETMQKIKQETIDHAEKYRDGDAVFFVTTQDVLTSYHPGQWNGAPETGRVCIRTENIGLVTDDGKTFKGVQDMAQQIAVLIGASLTSNCSNTTKFIPPSVFETKQSILSSCNEEAIMTFLSTENSSHDCVKIPSESISKSKQVLPAVYNNNTAYDLCTAGTTSRWREVRPCKKFDEKEKWKRVCRLQCCEYHSQFTRHGRGIIVSIPKMADGSPCGKDQICIYGKCENVTQDATTPHARIS